MRYVPTVNDDSLKNGLSVSVGLHVAMSLFLFFGLPHLIPPLPSHHEPVPFDIVTIAEITNTRIENKPEEPKPPAPAPAPQPKPAPVPPTPTPPKPPEPKAVEQQAEALKPKPIEKPKPPQEKPAPPKQDLLASVLKDVAKLKPAEAVRNPDPKADAKTQAPAANTGPALSSRLSITEEDFLRRQIEQCWNPPVGARDAQNLIVEVIIDVSPERVVLNTDIVDKMRYASDPFFRAAADSAIRALRSPKCSPLSLPADKYEEWKRIDFTFDPRDML